ncbi:hypothetical protein Tco_1075927 [Tanacetum coccineum]
MKSITTSSGQTTNLVDPDNDYGDSFIIYQVSLGNPLTTSLIYATIELKLSESKRNEVFFERYDKRGRMRRKSIKLEPANTRIRGFEYLSANKLGRCSKWGWTEDRT